MKLSRAVLIVAAVSTTACGLLVAVGDHHLRDEAEPLAEAGEDAFVAPDAFVRADTSTIDSRAMVDASSTCKGCVVVSAGRIRPAAVLIDSFAVYWIEDTLAKQKAIMRFGRDDDSGVTTLVTDRQALVAFDYDPRVPGFFFTEEVAPSSNPGIFRYSRQYGLLRFDDTDGFHWGALSVPDRAFSVAVDPAGGIRIRSSDVSGSPQTPNYAGTCFVYQTNAVTTFPVITADTDYVWFADTKANAIMRVPSACGSPSATVFAADQTVTAMTKDGANIYWTTADGAVRHLAKLSPGGTPYDHVTGRKTLSALDTRSGDVFYTDEGDGTVWRVTNQTTTLLASDQGRPRGIAACKSGGDKAIAWTNNASGTVVLLPAP